MWTARADRPRAACSTRDAGGRTQPTSWVALMLILGGIGLLAWSAAIAWHAAVYHRAVAQSLAASPVDEAIGPVAPRGAPEPGDSIGMLEAPRLGLAGPVASGDHESVLRTAIGHLRETALPWESGNTVLAGHRDTFFRPLRYARVGDVLRFTTTHGVFEYRIESTAIVDPDALWVLDPTPVPTLTLITCYPFQFIGPAPRRFIVRAVRSAS